MSGTSKHSGRGASRAAAARMVAAAPPPLGRGMAVQPLRRHSLGNGLGMSMGKEATPGRRIGAEGNGGNPNARGGGGAAGGAGGRPERVGTGMAMSSSQEESFQLLQQEQGDVRPFAMAIRLTPELLRDLKRVEAEGGACLMKFGVTPAGHVIKIGDEEFKFASAPEPGDLCDIFEEQRRGEDGNGILKEAGSVWRKLSVLRTLNASEKDRVKNRSKEAEQKQKSRKAIILDPTHSMVKNQNSSGVGDASSRRAPIITKHQPPMKKMKTSTSSPAPIPVAVSAPAPKPKPVASTASVIASAKAAKAASVASPELPPPMKISAPLLPPPKVKPCEEDAPATAPSKSVSAVQTDSTPSPATTTPDIAGPARPGGVISASDLRNSLINLLTENPKGMTIKAVEKALGEQMPHVKPERKTIEKAIKAIASYHAPGKYMLKEGVTYAKPSPNSGSSPENAAADSPPLVDSPALPDTIADSSSHDPSHQNSKAPSHSHKPSPAPAHQKPKSAIAKEHEAGPDTEQISVGGDESQDLEIIEGDSHPDTNVDSHPANWKGGNGSVPSSPKEEARAGNSGGSDSSSSSGSSGSDSDSSDSGDSATSGSGSGSDSDGSSSSGSDDENMDEDVEIMSDEDGETPHQKSKGKDKKQASRQAKEAKRAKLKPPEKLLTAHDSEEVDIGGDEGGAHPEGDSDEKPTNIVENLDSDEIEVDVISVGGAGSPHNSGSHSPAVSQQQNGESPKDVVSEATKTQPTVSNELDAHEKILSSNSSLAEGKRPGSGLQESAVEEKKVDLKITAKGDGYLQSREERAESILGKANELEAAKIPMLKGRINGINNNRMGGKNSPVNINNKLVAKESPVHSNSRPPRRESPVHSVSPSRPTPALNSLLGSPALRRDVSETSSEPAKENPAKPRINPAFRRKEADSAAKVARDLESEELADKIVEAPMRPRPRPNKNAEMNNRLGKPIDTPQLPRVDPNSDFSTRSFKDTELADAPGRDSDADILPGGGRNLRDGPWRHNPDAGLLGKPGRNVEYLGRSQHREADANNMYGNRQVKRRPIMEPEATRRSDPVNDSESWGKSAKDGDGTTRSGNDSGEVPINKLREGRKELIRQEVPKGSGVGGANRQNERLGMESPDLELGELREPAQGLEQWDSRGRDQSALRGAVDGAATSKLPPNKSQISPGRGKGRNVGKSAGDLTKPSPGKTVGEMRRPSPIKSVGDIRKPSPAKAAGDLRKPPNLSPGKAPGDVRKRSPALSNTQRNTQVAQKELQKPDLIVARDSSRAASGSSKQNIASLVEERPDVSLGRNGRAVHNDTSEMPTESRGVKRPLEDTGTQEATRVYKKPSTVPAAPSSSLNRSNLDLAPASRGEKKQVSPDLVTKPRSVEMGRGGSSDGLSNLAGPSGKAPSGENGHKQRPLRNGQRGSERESMEPPKGRDLKLKTSVGFPGAGGDKRKESLQPDQGLSNGKRVKSSSPDEISGKAYFSKYEKDVPDLRGPVRTYEEVELYKNEYQAKYAVYILLHDDLVKNRVQFTAYKKEMDIAGSPDKLQQINVKVRKQYQATRKEIKRMQKTFDILHEELQTIKQHLKDFAEKAGQG